ncbi:hypothetical protein RJ640_009551 [Escallonia rubra]|uniref:WRKY domain-containing protein n=1 Tax=Escallonia rubra TaxID=112253 RepID=A0AA88QYR5_9ASTE|nr:hypothetical protein RJ640_009551 [Escallonia rubra]
MENYQGDLGDIVRATGGGGGGGGGGGSGGSTSDRVLPVVSDWHQFQSDPLSYPPDDFGRPFSSSTDPLLYELDMSESGLFNRNDIISPDMIGKTNTEDSGGAFSQKTADEEMNNTRPRNMFSRMLQISPISTKLPLCDSPTVATASPRGHHKAPAATLLPNDMMISEANTSRGLLAENAGVQISSPRNTGIKRRKSQAKKVVCIPAPAPANSRPTGEIVPSDLWAWRKYGQKPIKGSPYPRGYYRCSSSKGCSARKQVERSRTDPNMLVITYTSEHNHPWPTQRNALAGSTRSQPTKSSKNSPTQKFAIGLKEEQKETDKDNVSSPIANTGNSDSSPLVKEEMEDLDKHIDMDDGEFGEGFPPSYRPALPDSSNHSVDFFADLGEIEADPLDLLFTQGFSADEDRENSKALDPFTFYDWTPNNTTTTSSGDQAKKGL